LLQLAGDIILSVYNHRSLGLRRFQHGRYHNPETEDDNCFCGTTCRGYARSLWLLVSALGAASISSAHAITWTLNGTFTDVGTVSGTFVFNPFDFTPANSAATASVNATQFFFGSLANYVGGEIYVVEFVTVSPLSDAGGVVNINLATSANCFNCAPYRLFASGTVTGATTPPATPAPSTLLLMLIGLGCVGLYAARHRRHSAMHSCTPHY
jgi:hypothetical protein